MSNNKYSLDNLHNKIQNNLPPLPKTLLIVLASYISFKGISSFIKYLYGNYIHNQHLKDAVQYREKRNEKIEAFINKYKDEVSTETQNDIIYLTAKDLCEKIKNKTFSIRQVYISFALRCATIGKFTYNLADADFEYGVSEADKKDKELKEATNVNDLPAFFGLPVTIKDQIQVKGLVYTNGFIVNRDKVSKENSLIVDALLDQGAIVLCKSNIVQGLLSVESSNNIFLKARSPWHTNKTSGGSSGGEGGLVSSYCSPLGIGSDIGGSIRQPCALNGIYGFKGTVNRVSTKGMMQIDNTTHLGFNNVLPSFGPMTNDPEDLVFFSKNIFGNSNFKRDFRANTNTFNHKIYDDILNSNSSKKLKIGFCYDLPYCEVSPGIVNNLKIVLEKLKQQGHEIIEFPLNNFMNIFKKGTELVLNSNKLHNMLKYSEGEKLTGFYDTFIKLNTAPSWSLPLLPFYFNLIGEKRSADYLENYKRHKTPVDLFKCNADYNKFKEEFYQFYQKENFDFLITPITSYTSLDLGKGDVGHSNVHYSMIFNMLDMPACAIPTGLNECGTYKTKFNDKVAKYLIKSEAESKGLPTSLQVVCLPNEDEKCLAYMKIVDSCINFSKNNEIRDIIKEKCSKINDFC